MIRQTSIRGDNAGSVWRAFAAWKIWLSIVTLSFGMLAAASSAAQAETRTLTMYHLHTGERITVAFKKDGRYIPDGLTKLNRFLRDWRRNEPTRMDPRLFDVIWQVYQASGSRQPINVVCGYRSPQTNSMLRHRSRGVAEKSQHMLGKAMDFYIPDVKLAKVRELGLKLGAGGVGYYPTSGSPFVHLDVGTVRHWPRMSRRELVAIFPHGGTLHVPSDGKPLPGYDQALAAYQARKQSGSIMMASASGGTKKKGFFSSIFGGGADEAEDDSGGETVVASAAPARNASGHRKLTDLPGVSDASDEDDSGTAAAPAAASAASAQNAPAVMAELPNRGVPLPIRAPRPDLDVGGIAAAEQAGVETAAAPEPATADDETASEDVAAAVPLPTRRPDYGTAQVLAADASAARQGDLPNGESDMAALSFAERLLGSSPAKAPIPSLGHEAAAPKEERLASIVPQARPEIADETPAAAGSEPTTGSIDATASEDNNDEDAADAADGDQDPVDGEEAFAEPDESAEPQAPSASPRLALLKTGNAASALAGAHTTAKSDRPTAADGKRQVKPFVVSVDADEAARWAIRKPGTAPGLKSRKRPLGCDAICQAPGEVLTQGFEQTADATDTGRFSGKAVTFLPVARFATN